MLTAREWAVFVVGLFMGVVLMLVLSFTSARAEEVPMICPQVIPAAIKVCHDRGTVPCTFGHKVERFGHEYNEYTLIEFDQAGGIIMQGSFKGVIIDYNSDGIIDQKPALFGGYDSRKNASGRNGTTYPQGKFGPAQAIYESECEKLATIFLPAPVAMATDSPIQQAE